MAINRINNFYFIKFERPGNPGAVPELLGQELDIIQRPGVNGTAISLEGVKGRPFQMTSGVDTPTRSAAENLRLLYLTIQGNQKVDLVFNDVDYASFHGVRYVVESVEAPIIKRLSAAVGGLSVSSNFWLQVTWNLIPVHA